MDTILRNVFCFVLFLSFFKYRFWLLELSNHDGSIGQDFELLSLKIVKILNIWRAFWKWWSYWILRVGPLIILFSRPKSTCLSSSSEQCFTNQPDYSVVFQLTCVSFNGKVMLLLKSILKYNIHMEHQNKQGRAQSLYNMGSVFNF